MDNGPTQRRLLGQARVARASCSHVMTEDSSQQSTRQKSTPVVREAATIVRTPSGALEGVSEEGLTVFLGVPYARPPTADARWRPPLAVRPWPGIRPACHHAASAPQAAIPALAPGVELDDFDEDCLYLDVFVPTPSSSCLPVIVWLHGGAFLFGSSAMRGQDPRNLAREGVVVVSVNYRLGALAGLALDLLPDASPGEGHNLALLDQVAALRWVEAHIAAFGGDPERVTLAGHSAGAHSIGTLLAMPLAEGLFGRVILQSGAAERLGSIEQARTMTNRFFDNLPTRPRKAAELRRVSLTEIMRAQSRCSKEGGLGAWCPVVDGRTVLEPPILSIHAGRARPVDVLIGTTADECSLFRLASRPVPVPGIDALVRMLESRVGPAAREIVHTYAMGRPGLSPERLLIAIESDLQYRLPAIRLAEAMARNGAAVWCYTMAWTSPTPGLRACHGIDLPFVLGHVEDPAFAAFAGRGRAASALSARMRRAWVAFAARGDPGVSALPRWPNYDPVTRSTMVFDRVCQVAERPHDTERAIWEAVGCTGDDDCG